MDENIARCHAFIDALSAPDLDRAGAHADRARCRKSCAGFTPGFENGLIVHRIQQADVPGQMRRLYGRPLGLAELAGLFRLLPVNAKGRG